MRPASGTPEDEPARDRGPHGGHAAMRPASGTPEDPTACGGRGRCTRCRNEAGVWDAGGLCSGGPSPCCGRRRNEAGVWDAGGRSWLPVCPRATRCRNEAGVWDAGGPGQVYTDENVVPGPQ